VAHEILVTLTRGNLEESHHYGAYAVYKDGAVVRSRGDIATPYYMRSAAKPIQALAVVESGAPDRFEFTDKELALVVGSHNGAPRHARAAKSMLRKIGVGDELLRCGGHRPLSPAVYEDYVRRGITYGRLEDNCSGKHAGMIGAAKALDADPATYHMPEHPVQQQNRANIALLAGIDSEDIPIGVDGCGVPAFGVPVAAVARAAAVFASPDELPGGIAMAARRIADVMCAHPDMVAGEDRFDTRIMRATEGRLISKEGAEGVQFIGLRGQHTGIAVKIHDGAARAAKAVAAALLVDLGIVTLQEISHIYPREVYSREGAVVGEIKVRL